MYPTLLLLHSWNRWLVLVAAAVALLRAYRGWSRQQPFTAADNAAGGAFVGFLDLQMLLGMWLYFGVSPTVQAARHDWSAAIANPTLRFWAVEHISLMLLGVVVAHVGRSLSKRAASAGPLAHRRAALYFTAAVALLLLAIPFVSRPLFRY